MIDATPLQFAFLTLPENEHPILNLKVEREEIARYALSREQLFALNAQIADALLKRCRQ